MADLAGWKAVDFGVILKQWESPNKKVMVNLDSIAAIAEHPDGTAVILLKGGSQVGVSHSFAEVMQLMRVRPKE